MCLRWFYLSRRSHEDVPTRVRDDVRDTAVSFLGIKNISVMVSAVVQNYSSVAFVACPM